MKFSLIIPTLNEKDSIARLFDGLRQASENFPAGIGFEVVVVDDGSSDGTVDEIKKLKMPFDVVTIERKERGLATAVIRGFAAATGDYLGVIDADLSHPTDLLSRLIEEAQTYEVVVASRNLPGGLVEEWPWYRLYASRAATLLVRPLGVKSSDPMSGFFIIRRQVIDHLDFSPVGYKILLEILVKGKYASLSEVPYIFRNRLVGKSKAGLREAMNYLRHLGRLYKWKILKRR